MKIYSIENCKMGKSSLGKLKLISLLFMLIIGSMFFVACDNSVKIKRGAIKEEPINFNYAWYVNGSKIDAVEGEFIWNKEFDNTAVVVEFKYQIEAATETVLDSQYITKISNNVEVNDVKDVGSYNISADLSMINIEESIKNLVINIDKVEICGEWVVNCDKELLTNYSDMTTYKIKYDAGVDILSKITVKTTGNYNANNSATFVIEKGNNLISEITTAGEYILTISGYSNEVYNIQNPMIRIILAEEIVLDWDIEGTVVVDDTYEIVYSAENIYSTITITNQISSYQLVVRNSDNEEITFVKDVDLYTCTILSDYYYFLNNDIKLKILPKNIYIVAENMELNYIDNVPDMPKQYNIYTNYEPDKPYNNIKLSDDWSDSVQVILDYKDTTKEDIDNIVASWSYDESGDLSKSFDIEVAGVLVPKEANYNTQFVGAKLTISLKQVEVAFVKDSDIMTAKVRTYYQTQKIPVSVANTIKAQFVENRDLTDWYVGGKLFDFENTILRDDINIDIFSIYNIYYMDSEDVGNSSQLAKVPYDHINSVTYPSNYHITSGNYSQTTTLPSKEGYTLNGWKNSSGKKVNIVSTNKNSLKEDVYLYPNFELFTYKNVIILKWVIEKQVIDDDGNIVTNKYEKKEQSYNFNIEEYDRNEDIVLEVTEEEGYQFVGWYHNKIKLENNKFKLSDFISSRDKIETMYQDINAGILQPIVLETKYEVEKCIVTLTVNGRQVKELSLEIGSELDKNYLTNLIEKKFGFIYIIGEAPSVVGTTAVIVRVIEFPLLYVVAGLIVVGGLITIIIYKTIIKRRNDIEKSKLDNIFNRLGK